MLTCAGWAFLYFPLRVMGATSPRETGVEMCEIDFMLEVRARLKSAGRPSG